MNSRRGLQGVSQAFEGGFKGGLEKGLQGVLEKPSLSGSLNTGKLILHLIALRGADPKHPGGGVSRASKTSRRRSRGEGGKGRLREEALEALQAL